MQPGSDREITCYTSVQIRQAIQKNVVLSKVLQYTEYGWPEQVEKDTSADTWTELQA